MEEQYHLLNHWKLLEKNLSEVQPTTFAGVPRIYNKFKEKVLEKMPQNRLNILLKIPIISGIIKEEN